MKLKEKKPKSRDNSWFITDVIGFIFEFILELIFEFL